MNDVTKSSPEIKFAPCHVPQSLQNGPHWYKPEGIHSIRTEISNLGWLLDKHHITDAQILDSLRRISGYVSYLEGRSRPNESSSAMASQERSIATESESSHSLERMVRRHGLLIVTSTKGSDNLQLQIIGRDKTTINKNELFQLIKGSQAI